MSWSARRRVSRRPSRGDIEGAVMARIEGETVVGCRPEVVFDFVADERNEPVYNPRMVRAKQVSDGPIGKGTRFLATTTSLGRELDMVIEISEYQRPSRLTSITRMASADIRGVLTFEPDPAGTRVHWTWLLRPRGISKLLTPVIGPLGRRQEQANWTNLKHYLEAAQWPDGGEPSGEPDAAGDGETNLG